MQIKDITCGIFFTLFGLYFVVFHSKISNDAIRRWYKKHPHIKIWEKGYTFGLLFLGSVFIIFGILSLFGIIKFK
jgi:hypothetical protein